MLARSREVNRMKQSDEFFNAENPFLWFAFVVLIYILTTSIHRYQWQREWERDRDQRLKRLEVETQIRIQQKCQPHESKAI